MDGTPGCNLCRQKFNPCCIIFLVFRIDKLSVYVLFTNVLSCDTQREKNDLALNQKLIKIKCCENGVNSDLKMI